ncbi:hypothetical protein AB3X91_03680 [Paraburkholderia sp. BR14263]|uniref:hypothetical protein n=1 Tax=unclassified Paraburkholderia TaxID=2615204 RepID=UPI0034CF9C9F
MRTIVLTLTLALAACATQGPVPKQPVVPTRVIDTACEWVKPISASPADTIETKQQILALDLALDRNCPRASRKTSP